LESKRYVEPIFKVVLLDAAQKVSSLGFKSCAKMCHVHRANPSSRKAQQSWIPHKSAQSCCQSWYKLMQEFHGCGSSPPRLTWIRSQKVSNMDRPHHNSIHAREVLAYFVRSIGPVINSFMLFTKVLGIWNSYGNGTSVHATMILPPHESLVMHLQPASTNRTTAAVVEQASATPLVTAQNVQLHRIMQLNSHHYYQLQVLNPSWSWTYPTRRDKKRKSQTSCRSRWWWKWGITQWWQK